MSHRFVDHLVKLESCLQTCMTYTIAYHRLSSRTRWSSSQAVYKPVWHIPLLSVQIINSWWWTDELPETCRVSQQNKFVKLVHLVGFIIKKFVTIHGNTNKKRVKRTTRELLGAQPVPNFGRITSRRTYSKNRLFIYAEWHSCAPTAIWNHGHLAPSTAVLTQPSVSTGKLSVR